MLLPAELPNLHRWGRSSRPALLLADALKLTRVLGPPLKEAPTTLSSCELDLGPQPDSAKTLLAVALALALGGGPVPVLVPGLSGSDCLPPRLLLPLTVFSNGRG